MPALCRPVAGEATASAPSPRSVTMVLRDATPLEVAAALSEALGVQVSAPPDTGAPPRATLQLVEVTPLEALNRAAAAFHGRWFSVFAVLPAVPGAPSPPPPFRTGRRVSLDLGDTEPRTALSTVARAAGGELATSQVSGARITIQLDEAPVEEAMDRIAAKIGHTWSRTFRLVPGRPLADGTPAVNPPDAANGTAVRASHPRTQALFSLTDPTEPNGQAAGRGPAVRRLDLARALSDGLTRLMQVDPAHRRGAVRQFAQQVERGLKEVSGLTPEEQVSQRTRVATVYRSGMRVFRGLTPDQQAEFRPLFDVLRRWLGL